MWFTKCCIEAWDQVSGQRNAIVDVENNDTSTSPGEADLLIMVDDDETHPTSSLVADTTDTPAEDEGSEHEIQAHEDEEDEQPNNKKKDLEMIGVSVQHLATDFLEAVLKVEGLSRDSKIYEIDRPVLRERGKGTLCPMDGQLGCSYTHAVYLDSAPNNNTSSPPAAPPPAGPATYMLSYTWGYTIGDIIDTLMEHCKSVQRDPKDTYIWICCLCVNQHRLAHVDFEKAFRDRVLGVGKVLAMMSPWSKPLYLTRVWCVFEIFTAAIVSSSDDDGSGGDGDEDADEASTDHMSRRKRSCEVTIVMPPAQQKSMSEALVGGKSTAETTDLGLFYKALAATKVEEAQATMEQDRINILNMVERGVGYAALNTKVNEFLRAWVLRTIRDIAAKKEALIQSDGGIIHYEPTASGIKRASGIQPRELYATFCNNVGRLLHRNGEADAAIEFYEKAKAIQKEVEDAGFTMTFGKQKQVTNHGNQALALNRKGQHKEALEEIQKALDLSPEDDIMLNNRGSIFQSLGRFDEALADYKRALEIRLEKYGEQHSLTSSSYSNIGLLLHKRGKHNEAIEMLLKAKDSAEASSMGQEDPNAAVVYNNIGLTYESLGKLEEAEDYYMKCLAIRESILGKNHEQTGNVILNMAALSERKGDSEGALAGYRKALAVFEVSAGPRSESAAIAHNNIGSLLFDRGDIDGSMRERETSLRISSEALGEDHPTTAIARLNYGSTLVSKGKSAEAVSEYKRALQVLEKAYGRNDVRVERVYSNMGAALQRSDVRAAIGAFKIALAIAETVHGKSHLQVAKHCDSLAALLFNRNEFEEAVVYLRRAVKIREQKLGRNHPLTKEATSHLTMASRANNRVLQQHLQKADDLCRAGDYEGARSYYAKGLIRMTVLSHRLTEALGDDDWDNATLLESYSRLLSRRNFIDGAFEMMKKALSMRESVRSKFHKDLSVTYFAFAEFKVVNKKEPQQAVSDYREFVKFQETQLQANGPALASLRSNLAKLLLMLPDSKAEAITELRKALDIRFKADGVMRESSVGGDGELDSTKLGHCSEDTFLACIALGDALFRETKDTNAAMVEYNRATTMKEAMREKAGKKRSTYGNKGDLKVHNLLQETGKYELAWKWYRRWKGHEDSATENLPSFAKAKSWTYYAHELRKFPYQNVEGALFMRRNAIGILEGLLDADSSPQSELTSAEENEVQLELIKCYLQLAERLYADKKDPVSALALRQQALILSTTVHGESCKDTKAIADSIAKLEKEIGPTKKNEDAAGSAAAGNNGEA